MVSSVVSVVDSVVSSDVLSSSVVCSDVDVISGLLTESRFPLIKQIAPKTTATKTKDEKEGTKKSL